MNVKHLFGIRRVKAITAMCGIALFAVSCTGGHGKADVMTASASSTLLSGDDSEDENEEEAKGFLTAFLKSYIESGCSTEIAKSKCTDDFFKFYELARKGKSLNDDGELTDDEPHDLIFPTPEAYDKILEITGISSAGEMSFLVKGKAKSSDGEEYEAQFVMTVAHVGNAFLLDDSQWAE